MKTPLNVSDPGWKEIARLGWGTWSNDFKKVSRLLRKLYTPHTVHALSQFACAKVNTLYKKMSEYEKLHRHLDIGSDDGLSDVLYHVVGLGEEEFNKVMMDFTLLEKRYNAPYGSPEGYTESFSYCFLELNES